LAHEANGNSAATRGDWRTALSEYADARNEDPKSPVLLHELERAVAETLKMGRVCLAGEEWGCALDKADDVLRVDSANNEAIALRRAARKGVARKWMRIAQDKWEHEQFAAAWDDLRPVYDMCDDEEVTAELRGARETLIAAAVETSERLAAAKRFYEAISLMELPVRLDPSLANRLAEMHARHEEEYSREVERAGAVAEEKRWKDAERAYRAAASMGPGNGAAVRADYCWYMARAVSAAAKGRARSVALFAQRALDTGMDDGGDAARLLDGSKETTDYRLARVEVRLAPGDHDNQNAADGGPDLRVEIRKGSKTVYASPTAQKRFSVLWLPREILVVGPGEQLTITLSNVDGDRRKQIITGTLRKGLLLGNHTFATPNDSFVSVSFEPTSPR
jgi:hypothetical protein